MKRPYLPLLSLVLACAIPRALPAQGPAAPAVADDVIEARVELARAAAGFLRTIEQHPELQGLRMTRSLPDDFMDGKPVGRSEAQDQLFVWLGAGPAEVEAGNVLRPAVPVSTGSERRECPAGRGCPPPVGRERVAEPLPAGFEQFERAR